MLPGKTVYKPLEPASLKGNPLRTNLSFLHSENYQFNYSDSFKTVYDFRFSKQ
jgi:hypothetical protein